MIEVAKSLTIGQTDTPLDARTRIDVLEDMETIPNPFLGMIVYCVADGKHYKVTALKSKQIGALTVPNAAVDTYTLSSASAAELSEHVADTVRHTTSEERAAALAGAATLTSHTGNSTIHITSTERAAWNAKANTADIPSDLSDLTDTSGLLDSGGGTDWNVPYTTTSIILTPGVAVKVSAATAAITLTLPSTITNGKKFPINIVDATHTITIARNGHKINGMAENDTSLTTGDCPTLVYDATADNLFLENEITTGDTELSDPIGIIDGRINTLRPALTADAIYYIGTSGKPTVQVTGIVADGSTAIATVTGTHAFVVGDSINLDSTVNFNGTFVLTAVTTTSLTWASAVTATESSLSYTYARYLQSDTAATIQAIIDTIPKNLGNHTVQFRFFDGCYDLSTHLTMEQFYDGKLILTSNSETTSGVKLTGSSLVQVRILYCKCSGLIRTITIENTNNESIDGAFCIVADEVTAIELEYVRTIVSKTPVTTNSGGLLANKTTLNMHNGSSEGGRCAVYLSLSHGYIYDYASTGVNPQHGVILIISICVGVAPTGQISNVLNYQSTLL